MAVSRSSNARSNCSGSDFSDLRPKAACLKAATSFSSARSGHPSELHTLAQRSASPSGQQHRQRDRRRPACSKSIKDSGTSPLEFVARVIVPHLFDGVRQSRLHGMDPTGDIEAGKQRLELGVAQGHQAVPDAWRTYVLPVFVGHHQIAAIPVVSFNRSAFRDRNTNTAPLKGLVQLCCVAICE